MTGPEQPNRCKTWARTPRPAGCLDRGCADTPLAGEVTSFASFGGRHYVENLLRRGQVRASSRQLRAEIRARGHSGLPFAARVLIGHGTRWWRAFGDGPVQATDGTDVDAARYEAALTHWKSASAREIMSWLVRSGHLEWRNERLVGGRPTSRVRLQVPTPGHASCRDGFGDARDLLGPAQGISEHPSVRLPQGTSRRRGEFDGTRSIRS